MLINNCQQLKKIIDETIIKAPRQQVTFADYMNLVLYHHQFGYYNSAKVKIGAQGDYFTSSSLGRDFGELLAKQLEEMWQILDYPQPFTIVEMGAGQGLLAADVLQYLQLYKPDLLAVLEYIIIELAEELISQQQKQLQLWLEQRCNITWKCWQDIPENSVTGCFFSNELIDAFPVHRLTIQQGNLEEIYVTLSEGNLVEITGEISTNQLADYFDLVEINLPSPAYPHGYQTEVNLAALDWLKKISDRLCQGYLLTIDYGYDAQRYYHPQRYQGTLKCYYQHKHHHNPYINLGEQDVTTHIDFTALENYGNLCGLERVGFTKQGLFLMALGLGDRLAALSGENLSLEKILQRRDALHQLIEPTGLGNFGVLIQSKGLNPQQRRQKLTGLSPSYL